jgi:hypothetical protein
MFATIGAVAKYKTTRGMQKAKLIAACDNKTNGRIGCAECGKIFRNTIEANQHSHHQSKQYWYCFDHGPEVLCNPTEAA